MNEGFEDIGIAVTAGLAAREAGRDGGSSASDADGGNCANCGAPVASAFCADCGQAGHLHRNLRGLGHDLAHGVFHFEGRIWHTLPLLAWRPGELTRRYVHGQRARFVPPVALFLFCVFLMFTTFALLGGSGNDVHAISTKGWNSAAARKDMIARVAELRTDEAKAEPAERAIVAKLRARAEDQLRALDRGYVTLDWLGSRASKADTGWSWLDRRIDHASANPSFTVYKIKTSAYKFSWALIPLSLPFLWLLFPFRRDIGLYDHAIFATYSLSFMTLLVVALATASALGLGGGWIFFALAIVVPMHMYRQLKGAYLLGRWGAGLRTIALLTFSLIVALLFVMLLLWFEAD